MKEDIQLRPWKPYNENSTYCGKSWFTSQVDSPYPSDYYAAFETKEQADRCILRELAMRKLYRFAEQLNPAGWNPENGFWHSRKDIAAYYEYFISPGIVPFHSEEACERAWKELSQEERESLFWENSNYRRKILVNQIRTPDGTMLVSRNRHDYVEHIDKNGNIYAIDGGNEYLRRIFDFQDYTEMSLYEDSNFGDIRKYYCRGGRGKNNDQPLKWVPLCEMSNEWIENCIEYNRVRNFSEDIYQKELDYRKHRNIYISEGYEI